MYVWLPKAMINIIQNLYELGWCLAILFGTQHTWYGGGSISNIFAMGAFWAILYLFYCSLQVLLVYFDHMHILKVSWCSNYGPIPCFDVVAAYLWKILHLGMEIWHVGQNARCLCSGGKNKVSMRDHEPWFIPYGYRMDDWVVFWCTILFLESMEKYLIILLFKVF